MEITNKNETVKGTWVFTPDQEPNKYNVKHEFVSSTDGKELPNSVKVLLPIDQKDKEDGSKVTPTQPLKTEVEDTENDGTWTFEGYKDQDTTTNEVDAKVNGADVTFEGTWKFTPNKHNVTYEYVSGTEGVELPEALKAKAPKDVTGKVKGDTVTSPVPTGKDAEYRDETNKGTWTFKSYDKDSVEITNKDENVKGTWVFTPDANVVTEYVDEDGKTIADKENGTKDKKDIPGYEFVRTETDDKGNTKHIYKKKTTPTPAVVTEYVDEDGKTIAPKEDGTQPNKEIEGYEFVKTEKDEQGNTKHIYKKKTTPTPDVVTEYVDEDGKTIADKENGTQPKKDIDGYEFVKTEKDEQGNTKHIYKKKTTPTPDVVTKFVDENGNPLAQDEKGKKDIKDIPAYEYVKTYTDKDGNTVHVYRLKQDPTPSVETRYVDENGNQLLPPKEGTKDPVTIEGYNFIITSKDKNGNTIHTYSKNPTEGVETRFVDTEGNQILADKAGTLDPSLINGYEFVRTEKDDDGNTTHIYRKLPTPSKEVVTKFLDENGNELASPLKGRNPSKEIPGYEILKTETDSDGNIIYVYRKKSSESQKVTKYVDENGNEISESTKGDNPKKNIDGYKFVKTTTDKDGNTVHIYRRKTPTPSVDKITKFVDEYGNEISKSIKGYNPKKDIDGYEFVKTTTDKDGNTVHIYRRKTSTPTVGEITTFVDENGNMIASSEIGKTPKKDIDGYEFVKTETDKDGNTVHIYKKKSSSSEANYKAGHKFESSTPGKELPKEVLDLLPLDQTGKENGAKVSPTNPSKTQIKVKDGTWVFEGYDKDSSIINNKDVEFVGKWKFIPNKKDIGNGEDNNKAPSNGPKDNNNNTSSIPNKLVPNNQSVSSQKSQISHSNVKTGIAGSADVIIILMGSAVALYKSRKNK